MGRLVVIAGGLIALVLLLANLSGGSETDTLAEAPEVADAAVEEVVDEQEEDESEAVESETAEDDAAQADDTDEDSAVETELLVDMEVAQIGDDFIRFRIASSTETAFTSVISQDGEIIITQEGLLNAEEILTERIEGLEPGTLYTVQSTLIGPPAVTSTSVLFRTNGDIPDPESDSQTPAVNITSLEITDIGPTHFQFDYFSDQCANGSFVVIEQESGEQVGKNDGGPESCVTRSLGVPGTWTPPLEPETTYVVTINMEANGAGRGRPYGNVATETLVVTTPPRPIPDDPIDREVPAVVFTSIEAMETTSETVRVDYSTNVCTNGSFVVREVGGAEVGRHPGSSTGCATQHSAIAGLWTEPLEPETDYVIVLTAEADGAGQGGGNVATESINVSTFAEPSLPADMPDPVVIEQLDSSVANGTASVTVLTNSCAEIQVTALQQFGDQLTTPSRTTPCAEETQVTNIALAEEGDTVLLVTAIGEDFGPGDPNRASEVIYLSN